MAAVAGAADTAVLVAVTEEGTVAVLTGGTGAADTVAVLAAVTEAAVMPEDTVTMVAAIATVMG